MYKTNWSKKVEYLQSIWTHSEKIPEYREVMINQISDLMKRNNDYNILDCGCGTGLMYKYLPDEYKDRYYGIDFTYEMIEYCKKNYPEHSDNFKVVDLTKGIKLMELKVADNNIVVTQNVLQHILLFQEALDNIFYIANDVVLLCERTHLKPSMIVSYEPAIRWRFNIKDMYDILTHFKNKYGYNGLVEIISQPKTTFNEENKVTIFKVERRNLTSIDFEKYREKYFVREPLYNNKKSKKKKKGFFDFLF